MNKTIAIVLFSLLTGSVFGQKCQYLSNTVSGMDGTRLVITEPQLYAKKSPAGQVDVWAKLHLDSLIVLSVVLHDSMALEFHKGDPMILLEEDTELLSLEILQDALRDAGLDKPLTVYALVSLEGFETVKNSVVNELRLKTPTGWMNIEARNTKQAKSLVSVLGCIAVFLE
jgi:hypothetical protein